MVGIAACAFLLAGAQACTSAPEETSVKARQQKAAAEKTTEAAGRTTPEATAERTETTKSTDEETILEGGTLASVNEQDVTPAPDPSGASEPPEAVESSAASIPEECYPSCQGAAIRRGVVSLTEQEEANLRASGVLAPEVEPARAPAYQSSDPEAPYYRPSEGPCLGQCTDAQGRNWLWESRFGK